MHRKNECNSIQKAYDTNATLSIIGMAPTVNRVINDIQYEYSIKDVLSKKEKQYLKMDFFIYERIENTSGISP